MRLKNIFKILKNIKYILAQMISNKPFYYLDRVLNNFLRANISQLNVNRTSTTYH